MDNPNVKKSVNEFRRYIREIKKGTTAKRKSEIYTQIVVCGDLIQYSAEVANTNSKGFQLLNKVMNDCCKLIEPKNRIYISTLNNYKE